MKNKKLLIAFVLVMLFACLSAIFTKTNPDYNPKETPVSPTLVKMSERFSTLPPVYTQTLVSTVTLAPSRTVVVKTIVPLNTINVQITQSSCSVKVSCSSFSTKAEAQNKYEECGKNNWNGLDRDKDGIACEDLK